MVWPSYRRRILCLADRHVLRVASDAQRLLYNRWHDHDHTLADSSPHTKASDACATDVARCDTGAADAEPHAAAHAAAIAGSYACA
jgi:hypothetical protein